MKYYVYIYYDSRKEPPEPIYVGKGKGERWKFHVNKSSNPILKRKIKKMRAESLEPIVKKVLENLSNDAAILEEKSLIAKYGRIDKSTGTLCNLTDGGEGTEGYKHKDETKKLFSRQRKGKKQTSAQYKVNCSRVVSEKTKTKISVAVKGHNYHTSEQIEKIKEHNRTREITDEMRAKWSKAYKGKNVGSSNGSARLTWDDVRDIRKQYIPGTSSYKTLAKEYSVSYSAIFSIIKQKTWKEKVQL